MPKPLPPIDPVSSPSSGSIDNPGPEYIRRDISSPTYQHLRSFVIRLERRVAALERLALSDGEGHASRDDAAILARMKTEIADPTGITYTEAVEIGRRPDDK